MLLMRGAASDLKVMAESVDSVGHTVPSTTTVVHSGNNFRRTNINLPASKNNNKTNENFKSQSPSEDKAIQYGGLPCETHTDHMYHTNFVGDSSKYRELADEVAHLKALVLFHLDLIQQQSECNAAKDKQLSALRHENEMLRQKLDRMERRVQLQTSKQKPEQHVEENLFSVSKGMESLVQGTPAATRAQPKVSVGPNASYVPEVPSITNCHKTDVEIPRKRIKTLLPVRTKAICPSPPAKRRRMTRSIEADVIIKSETMPHENILDDLINQAVQDGAIANLTESNLPSDRTIEAKLALEPCPVSGQADGTPAKKECSNISLEPAGGKESSNVLDLPIYPEHERIKKLLAQKPPARESVHVKKESILTTAEPYLTHVGESPNHMEVLTNQVEVPQWVIKPLSGRATNQGIENLDDEVFTKRHLKHEMDEKRRKRWDLQRIREQRKYEKLRARYEGEDRSQDRIRTQMPTEQEPGGIIASFWAGPEDVTHIQVEPWLPVSVFGAPLPNISAAEFQLPWSSSRSGSELAEQGTTTSKRRQRRSIKTI